MALKFEKGVLTSPGATGNQTISLVDTGFGTVKALMLWAAYHTAEGDTDGDGIFSIGLGADRGGTPSQWCVSYFDEDAVGTSALAIGMSSASILRGLLDSAAGLDYDVALDSLGNAQFVLNWTNLPATASIKVHYVALGGSDITDALVGTVDAGAATGTVDETVASGFGKPDLLFSLLARTDATEGDVASHAALSFGVGKDDANEAHSLWMNEDARPSMEASVHQTSTFAAITGIDSAMFFVAELTARTNWPADGFQLNVVTAHGNMRMGYLALRGTFTAVIGSNTAPTAAPPVDQDLAVGATPRGAIFFHNAILANAAQDSTHADLGTFGLGAMDGTREGWAGVGQDDGNMTSIAHRHHSESKAVKMYTPSASGTLTSEADSSFVGTAVRLSWADTDTVAREYRYLLLGDSALIQRSTSWSLPLETNRGVSAPAALPLDATRGGLATSTFPLEWTAMRSSSFVLPLETLRGVAAALDLPLESMRGVAAAIALPLDVVGFRTTSWALPLEWTRGGVLASAELPLDLSLGVLFTAGLPLTWMRGVAATIALPLDVVGFRTTSWALPLDLNRGIVVAPTLPLEWTRGGLVTAAALPLDVSRGVVQAFVAPLESARGVAAALALPLESIRPTISSFILPAEWTRGGVVASAQLPLEWLRGVSTIVVLPIETELSALGVAALFIARDKAVVVFLSRDSKLTEYVARTTAATLFTGSD